MSIRLSDTQVADLLQSEVPWNIARRAFSNATARIEQIAAQAPISPVELRRLEFEAVADIARSFGITVAPLSAGREAAPIQPAPEPPAPPPGS